MSPPLSKSHWGAAGCAVKYSCPSLAKGSESVVSLHSPGPVTRVKLCLSPAAENKSVVSLLAAGCAMVGPGEGSQGSHRRLPCNGQRPVASRCRRRTTMCVPLRVQHVTPTPSASPRHLYIDHPVQNPQDPKPDTHVVIGHRSCTRIDPPLPQSCLTALLTREGGVRVSGEVREGDGLTDSRKWSSLPVLEIVFDPSAAGLVMNP